MLADAFLDAEVNRQGAGERSRRGAAQQGLRGGCLGDTGKEQERDLREPTEIVHTDLSL